MTVRLPGRLSICCHPPFTMASRKCTRSLNLLLSTSSGAVPAPPCATLHACRIFNRASSRQHALPTPCRQSFTVQRSISLLNPASIESGPLRARHPPSARLHHASRMPHRAFIALGSNLGDRLAMIEEACREMEADGSIRILRTSSLWETKAMYVLDQNKFVNGVCQVRRASVVCHCPDTDYRSDRNEPASYPTP